jgi:glycosyltransferase involved in cell wall biosynthesis
MDVAVITPTYNRAHLLPQTIDSVIAQTTRARIEMAVIDDGSTDDTADVMRPYIDKYGVSGKKVHIQYIQLDKQGVVTARNTGIERTNAPYIALLDSDDYWDPRKLELQLKAIRSDPHVGVVHTSFRYVDDQSRFIDDRVQGHRLNNPCVGWCIDAMLNEFLVIFSSVLIRRAVVEQVSATEPHGLPFDPRWTNAQDYDLMLRAARVSRFIYVPEPLTLYRFHDQHGAMGNLKRAFGFHCRVQMDFVARWGRDVGVTEADATRRAAAFLYKRAESAFWQRDMDNCTALCDLAAELSFDDDRFVKLKHKAARPRWMYRIKDQMDRMLGKSSSPGAAQ